MTEYGHQQVSSLVHDLVEMAEATRRLPQLEHQLRELEATHISDGDRIARLEMRLMERHDRIEELTQKLRSVEAERDDAGFRLLETEDRLDAIKRALGVPEAIANAVAKAELHIREELTPKPPQVEPELVIIPEAPQGATATVEVVQSEPTPIVETVTPSEQATVSTGDVVSQGSVSTTDGQVSGEAQPEQVPEVPASDPIGGSGETVSSHSGGSTGEPETKSYGPYFGKRYVDLPDFMRLDEWLAGGGTEADYHWRPQGLRAAQ